MDTSTGIALVSVMVAAASALYARYAWSTSRIAMAPQALMSILLEYRSAEMMDAVKTLWDFRRDNPGDSMVVKYEEIRKKDDELWRNAASSDKIAFVAGTLHFKRRLVSHFYAYLAHLVDHKILPEDIFYGSWSKTDLEIIPQVLVPLERGLGQALKVGAPAVLLSFQKLYDNAPKIATRGTHGQQSIDVGEC